MEELLNIAKDYGQYVNALFSNNPYIVPGLLCVALIALSLLHHYEVWPRFMERRMARKEEKKEISDIVCLALSEAVLDGKITHKARARWEKKFGKVLNLGDLIGKPKRIPPQNLMHAIKRRLYAMGVPVKEKLTSLKLRRKSAHRKRMITPKPRTT